MSYVFFVVLRLIKDIRDIASLIVAEALVGDKAELKGLCRRRCPRNVMTQEATASMILALPHKTPARTPRPAEDKTTEHPVTP